MTGSAMNPARPCPTCSGKGTIAVTNAKSGEVTVAVCPVCRGSKQSNGIATK